MGAGKAEWIGDGVIKLNQIRLRLVSAPKIPLFSRTPDTTAPNPYIAQTPQDTSLDTKCLIRVFRF